MESRQSDARNKVIAPVFKRLGIIDQWGNGLKLVAEEMKGYPEMELCWKEVGLSFQVQFVKMNYNAIADINDREMQLINLIRKEPKITANILNLSKRQCERIIADLKNKGISSRRGTNRTGYWIVEDL